MPKIPHMNICIYDCNGLLLCVKDVQVPGYIVHKIARVESV